MNTVTVDRARSVAGAEGMMAVANRYHSDAEFRAAVDADPAAFLAEKGVALPPAVEARVVCDTADTFHVVMPEDPNLSLDDEDLGMIAGGKLQTGSAGSVGSLSTIGTAPSCASTGATAGTASTAGNRSD